MLELKDKLKTEEAITKTEEVKLSITNEEETSEAIAALQVLGYTKREIEKALENIDTKNLQLEEIIKQGLKNLARNWKINWNFTKCEVWDAKCEK